MNIPNYLQAKLSEAPDGPGNRHKNIVELALMLVAEGNSRDECFEVLRERYPDKDKPDSEIYRAIDGAERKAPTPATASNGAPQRKGKSYNFGGKSSISKNDAGDLTIRVFKRDEQKPISPIPKVECSIAEFLDRLFKPGDIVCVGLKAYKPEGQDRWIPQDSGVFCAVERWKEILDGKPALENIYEPEAGAWIRMNPVTKSDTSGNDTSIAEFRHVLVEFDSKNKTDQWDIFNQCGLPISTIIDSGAKSLHAWVKVDATSFEEFKERQERVYEYLAEYIDDSGNKNPSRFSRMPGVTRNGNHQHVVAFDIGSKTWDDWEHSHIEDGYPDWEECRDFMRRDVQKPKSIIDNVLVKERVATFTGPSKSKKSYSLIGLSMAVTTGGEWFGLKCNKGKVLYANFELSEDMMHERVRAIADHLGIDLDDLDGFTVWNLRGHASDIEGVVDRFAKRLHKHEYDLIIIDPFYMTLGWRDENKAGDMTDFMNHINRLVRLSKATVMVAHHFAKGDAHEKSANDRGSGSGVLTRFPDVCAVLTPLSGESASKPERFDIEWTLREFADMDNFKIKWEYPIMRRMSDDEEQEMEQAKESYIVNQILTILSVIPIGCPMDRNKLIELGGKAIKKAVNTVKKRIDSALEQGLIREMGEIKIEGFRNKVQTYHRVEESIRAVTPPKITLHRVHSSDDDSEPF